MTDKNTFLNDFDHLFLKNSLDLDGGVPLPELNNTRPSENPEETQQTDTKEDIFDFSKTSKVGEIMKNVKMNQFFINRENVKTMQIFKHQHSLTQTFKNHASESIEKLYRKAKIHSSTSFKV